MNARCWLMAAMMACVPAASCGQDKKPDAKPQEIDKKTIAAWEKWGFGLHVPPSYARFVRSDFLLSHEPIPDIPIFEPKHGVITDLSLENLPPVEIPFGLILDNFAISDKGLKHLTNLKNLTSLDIGGIEDQPLITDAGAKNIAAMRKLKYLTLRFKSRMRA